MTFLDALQRSRVRYRKTPGSSEVQINCPFCPEKRGERDFNFCLHINIATGAGHCWHANCGFKGRHVLGIVLQQLRVDVDQLEAPGEEEAVVQTPIELPKDFQVLTHAYDSLDRKALSYLTRRGIAHQQIAERRIGVSYTGRYAYRIVIPVWVGETLRGIVARDFTGHHQPKYLNSVGDKYLYGFDPEAESCVLAEGCFKALRIEQATGWHAAALLGHDLTDIQLQQIRESKCQRVILFPDPDAVGQRGVGNMAEKLTSEWAGEVQVIWPISTPADEMTLEELRNVIIQPYSWELRQKLTLKFLK